MKAVLRYIILICLGEFLHKRKQLYEIINLIECYGKKCSGSMELICRGEERKREKVPTR